MFLSSRTTREETSNQREISTTEKILQQLSPVSLLCSFFFALLTLVPRSTFRSRYLSCRNQIKNGRTCNRRHIQDFAIAHYPAISLRFSGDIAKFSSKQNKNRAKFTPRSACKKIDFLQDTYSPSKDRTEKKQNFSATEWT